MRKYDYYTNVPRFVKEYASYQLKSIKGTISPKFEAEMEEYAESYIKWLHYGLCYMSEAMQKISEIPSEFYRRCQAEEDATETERMLAEIAHRHGTEAISEDMHEEML